MGTVRNVALLLLGLSAVMLLYGCTTPKNDGDIGDITVLIASKGTVHEVEVLDSGHCNVLIKANNGLVFSIIKKDLEPCKKLKKGNRVVFNVVLRPSPFGPGDIEKL